MSDSETQRFGTVSKVERQKHNPNRYNVYVDGEYAFAVHEDVLVKYRLLKGVSLQTSDMERIIRSEEINRAEQTAYRYLGYRPRTEKELRIHLREKGYDEETVDDVVRDLQRRGYVDDEQFARRWVQERMRMKPRGRYRLMQELVQKGVAEETIERVLGELDTEAEYAAAEKEAEKKWKRMKKEPWSKMRGKLGQYLQQKGYPSDVIVRIVDTYSDRYAKGDADR